MTGSAPKFVLEILPLRHGLIAGQDNMVDVLVKISATARQTTAARDLQHAPLDLSIVIDRSGSMSGAIDNVKRCVRAIINRMTPDDRIGVTAYDHEIETVIPFGPLTQRDNALDAIDALTARGQTALHAGWHAGIEALRRGQAAKDPAQALSPSGRLARVLLLSDGNANVGMTDPLLISRQCRQEASYGQSTSTFGIGRSFHEELMTAMASAGGGNAYYGKTAADLIGCYEEELDALRATTATGLCLRIGHPDGVTATDRSLYPRDGGRILLPDLAEEAAIVMMLRLHVPGAALQERRAAASAGRVPCARLGAHGTSLHDRSELQVMTCRLELHERGIGPHTCEASLVLPLMTGAAYAALQPNVEVAARHDEARAGELLEEAGAAASKGDWARVAAILEAARAEAQSNKWIMHALERLSGLAHSQDRERVRKEAHYQSRSMRTKLRGIDELADFDAATERERRSFLRRKAERGSMN